MAMSVEGIKVDMKPMIGLEMCGQGKQIPGQSGLSRIRPQMMQQVLSSFHLSNQKRNQMELLKLFPESRTPLENQTSYEPFSNGDSESRSVSGSSSDKESTAQMIILYNGAVKVYDVSAEEAQAVMELANSNGLSERATFKPLLSENEDSKKVTAGVPMARKLSLQRLLQKREDRLGSLSPYATTSKASAKDDEDEFEQLGLSLSFPSQRSG